MLLTADLKKMIKKLSVFYNKTKKAAEEAVKAVCATAECMNVEVAFDKVFEDTDLSLSIGGDGMVLKTARKSAAYNIPVASINLGTLGFLSEEVEEIGEFTRNLIEEKFETEERVMLQAGTGEEIFTALNDIVIKNGETARVINLELSIDNRKIYRFKGDGLIVASPTGSTAYTLAAGGPLVEPDLEVIIITPLNPHSFSNRSIVAGNKKIVIDCPEEKDEVILTADGQLNLRLAPPEKILIEIMEKRVRLVKGKEDFYGQLSKKLNW